MKKLKSYAIACTALVLIALVSATAFAQSSMVKLDKVHSEIGFTAATPLFDVDGDFKKYKVFIDGDRSNLEDAKLRVEIDTSSVFTANRKRDEHLRSPDFLAAKKHPKITFVSNEITKSGDKYNVTGTLEIRGQKKEITIPFEIIKPGGAKTAYRGKTTIDRNEFGVGSDSVAAKIGLKDDIELDILVVAEG